MMTNNLRFLPAVMLVIGGAVLAAKPEAISMPLRGSLTALPVSLDGQTSRELTISEAEVKAAGTSAHLMRVYGDSLSPAFTLYVGYHAAQSQSNQMHSPRNCLPGAGWQVLTSGRTVAGGREVNRYLIEFKGVKALVLYWYQGRGRVTADEFQVKLNLFADAAKTGRTEEALVRLVIPIATRTKGDPNPAGLDEAQAEKLGVEVATSLIPLIDNVLPAAPAATAESRKTVAMAERSK